MGVYIKSMAMPRHCTECPFWHGGIWEHCTLDENIQNDDLPEMAWDYPALCPLTEILEPHGKLVDSDMLYASIAKDTYLLTNENNSRDYGMFLIDIWKKTEGAPTVIVRNK